MKLFWTGSSHSIHPETPQYNRKWWSNSDVNDSEFPFFIKIVMLWFEVLFRASSSQICHYIFEQFNVNEVWWSFSLPSLSNLVWEPLRIKVLPSRWVYIVKSEPVVSVSHYKQQTAPEGVKLATVKVLNTLTHTYMLGQHYVQRSPSLRGINTLSCGPICLRVSLWPARVVEVVGVYICVCCCLRVLGNVWWRDYRRAGRRFHKEKTNTNTGRMSDKLDVYRLWWVNKFVFKVACCLFLLRRWPPYHRLKTNSISLSPPLSFSPSASKLCW